MPRYMLLLADDPSAYKDVTPAQMEAVIAKYVAWTGKMRQEGRVLSGEKLKDEGGKRIRSRNGKATVVDGPYAESKEVVGGFYIIKAANFDEAVKIASTCPHVEFGAHLDVREIDEMS
ncbi:MAG TPA: YciI family protein [Planctomycetota bacterium]|nr:YciI family protein [Planctomycetota bacterium]